MASEETIREVYQTLQAYTVLRYPLEPRKTDSASFDYAMALELLNRAEQCQNHDIIAAVGVARDRAGEAGTASPHIALPRLLSSRHHHNDNSSSPDLLNLTLTSMTTTHMKVERSPSSA